MENPMGSTALVTMDEMGKMAAAMVKSKLFGFETPEQALSIMMIAQAEGRPAALAARDYHVIKGRPALKADAMLARFQSEGGVVEWAEYTETVVSGCFSHPKSCPKPVKIEWTIDMAKRIGLVSRENWRNYPRAMLRARVISEGVRATFPGIAVGIYTVEEVQDFTRARDITPTSGAADNITEEQRGKMGELADRVREWMNQGSLTDAWAEIDNAAPDAEEYVYLWTFFDSRVRRQLKEEGERQKIKNRALDSNVISEAQKKRLEARIGELRLDRDEVKAECYRRFGKDHFAELTKDEYTALDNELGVVEAAAGAPAYITPDEVAELEQHCTSNGIPVANLLKAAKVERLAMIETKDVARATAWINAAIELRRQKAKETT